MPAGHTLRKDWNVLGERFRAKFPLDKKGLDQLLLIISGSSPRARFREVLSRCICDLDLFTDWQQKNWDSVTPTMKWLRASGAKFTVLLAEVLTRIELTGEKAIIVGLSEGNLSKIVADAKTEMVETMRRALLTAVDVPLEGTERRGYGCGTPAIDLVGELFVEIMLAGTQRNFARAVKSSDFADLIHCLYAPYTDIFRADKDTATLIAKSGTKVRADVVNDLKCLPEVIDLKLRQRA